MQTTVRIHYRWLSSTSQEDLLIRWLLICLDCIHTCTLFRTVATGNMQCHECTAQSSGLHAQNCSAACMVVRQCSGLELLGACHQLPQLEWKWVAGIACRPQPQTPQLHARLQALC
jgi:hypothetical protein